MKLYKSVCFFLTAVALALSVVCIAQSENSDNVDRYIKNVMTRKKIPGIAVAVIKDGRVLKESGYGLSNVELNVPVTKETVFEIASMSKQFTCAAILLLQQQGKLSIQDKLSKYLDSLPDSWSEIKLYQLMNHTAGLDDDWDEDTHYFLENDSDSLMFAEQRKHPLQFKPGEYFHYSSGPFTLGLVIAKVSGMPYARFMKEQIFTPLGMNATSIYDNRQIVPNRASGYIVRNSVITNGVDISPAAEARGDVGVITNIDDMIKWDAALNDDRLLNASSRDAMFTPQMLNDGRYISYGYGWEVYASCGHRVIEHGGTFRTGYNSQISRFPDQKITVIVLTNLYMDAYATAIADKIASFYSSDLMPVSERTAKPDPETARTLNLKNLLLNAAQKVWTDGKELDRHIFFCGASPALVSMMLHGFKQLIYIDEISSAVHPIYLYGENITKTVLYKTEADRTGYWSFGFNAEGKLVYALWEERWDDDESWD